MWSLTQGERGAKGLQLPETLSRLNWSFSFVLCIFFSWPVFATYSGFGVSSRNCSRTYPGYPNPQMFKSHIHSLVSMVLHLQIQPTSNPVVLQYCMYLLKKKKKACKVDLCSSNPCCSTVSCIYLFEQNFLPPSYLKMEVPLLGQPGVQCKDCMTENLISTWSECCWLLLLFPSLLWCVC